MKLPQIIGIVEGVTDGALRISQGSSVKEVALSAGQQLVQVASSEQAERVAAVVGGLAPDGDRQAAMAALYPHLPAKALAVVLGVADGLTQALENDGVLDSSEMMQIGMRAIQEAL